ncbi:hypothetical protein [Anabaena sp. CCY 0017]|uniref:hypothetical protein n=1 Tax=Anabaena sp. CCY 0017 TaxID=3103866 RepID=UPI0039C5B51A
MDTDEYVIKIGLKQELSETLLTLCPLCPYPKGRRYAVSVRVSVPEALAMPKALCG